MNTEKQPELKVPESEVPSLEDTLRNELLGHIKRAKDILASMSTELFLAAEKATSPEQISAINAEAKRLSEELEKLCNQKSN